MVDNYEIGPTGSPDQDKLTAAKYALSADLTVISYDSTNPHFRSKFASYGGVCDALHPLFVKHGFCMPEWGFKEKNEKQYLTGKFVHKSNQWRTNVCPLLLKEKTMQALGAATTYAKRQLLLGFTGAWVGEVDDDGNSASGKTTPVSRNGNDNYVKIASAAIQNAETKQKAEEALAVVEIRAREGFVDKEVLQRCKAVFDKAWK
jgi:hypothetical protein